jgi:hypothetical protein
MNMTYRDRQRLRAAQARRTAPAETKWPETIEELDALGAPGTQAQAPASSGAEARARLVQNAQQTLQMLQAQQAQRRQLAAQKAGGLQQNLMSSPYLSLAGLAAPGQSTRTLPAAYSGPDPEPGPPPDYGQQTPQPAPTPQPNQTQGAAGYSNYGMIDPGVAIAQQINAKKQQSSAVGFIDPALAEAQKAYQMNLSRGVIDPGYAEAERWYRTLHPEIYTEGHFVDLAPGDDVKNNPYGIDINQFLRWAYSQLGYHEKASDADLDDKYANQGGNNYTKFGSAYSVNGQAWCAAFASWCADQAGISKDMIFRNTSTNGLINSYMNAGRFQLKESYTPKAGDLILLQTAKPAEPDEDGLYHGKWDKNAKGQYYWVGDGGRYNLDGHTGIVIGCDDTYVYTIEGNAGDGDVAVVMNRRPRDQGRIKGYGVNGGSSSGYIPPDGMFS